MNSTALTVLAFVLTFGAGFADTKVGCMVLSGMAIASITGANICGAIEKLTEATIKAAKDK